MSEGVPQMLARLDALCPELALVIRTHIAEIDPVALESELGFIFAQALSPPPTRMVPAPIEFYPVAQRAGVADAAVAALTDILDIKASTDLSPEQMMRQVKDIHSTARAAVVQAQGALPETSSQDIPTNDS